MAIVTEISWDEVADPAFTPLTRQAFRTAVTTVADRARAAMPASHTRIDKAEALVLAGDVELLEGGTARVASQCQGATQYRVVNGTCSCKDFPQAPDGWCKHRLSAAIARRVQELQPTALVPSPATIDVVPEASTTLPAFASQHIVRLHGKPFVTFAGLLQMAHARGLTSLTADWTYNDDALSLATATAVFPFGTFRECGDASPSNVTAKISPHFRRMALTRAKSRVLRDALSIDMVAVEELADE